MGALKTIKSVVRKIGVQSPSGSLIYHRIKYSAAKTMRLLLGERGYAKWFYKLYMNKPLDLDNPSSVGEKFWWLKLNNRDPLMTICSDKVAVREYVKEHGFADTLMSVKDVFDSVDQLDLTKYSEEVIVKCTHNSGGHLFYDPKNPISEKDIEIKKKLLAFLLKQDASVLSLEWNYKNIPPRLIVERIERDSEGKLPKDYKIWCFNGEPKLVMVYFDRFSSKNKFNFEHTCNIYDMEFKLLNVTEDIPNSEEMLPKPSNWEYMVEMAKSLSDPFPFCRVDLYNIDGKVRFGELTFYDGGGCVSLHPDEWDKKVASWFDLESDKIVKR